MNRGTSARPLAAMLLLAGITGCALFSGKKGGPAQVDDLAGSVERTYVDSELSKERVRAAVHALQAIVETSYDGDAVAAFAVFLEAIEASEQQAERLRSSVESMKGAAEPVFKQWNDDLDEFTSAEMRQRSTARLAATRQRYDSIVAAVDPAQAAYDALNKGLRDHALFLSHDLNPASLTAIRDDVRNLANLADDLGKRLDECLLATRAYVSSAALPVRAVTPAAAEAVPVKAPAASQEQPRPGRVEKVRGRGGER